MIAKLVRYRVKAEEIAAVEAAVREFVSAIAEHEPGTAYWSYRTVGGRSYCHVMQFRDEESELLHQEAPYTRAFVTTLYPRCDAGPTYTDLSPLAAAGI
jgi:quinol monooxygenase YgiN